MLTPETVVHERYKVLYEVGAGGMGMVYRARDLRLQRDVALKCMTVNQSSVNVRAFEREAQLLGQLKHPALPAVSDFFAENGNHFLVMDFIDSEDLAHMIERSPFDVAKVLDWCDTLLDALDYMHNQPSPVVHRDIKPQNLKLSQRGSIMLLDFGLAKGKIDPKSGESSNSTPGFTPNYAAIEQMQEIGTDPRSDIYALGATMFHLLTGTMPYKALDRVMAKASGAADPLPRIRQLNPLVTKAISDVFAHALELGRDDRPNSAAEMRAALRTARGYLALPAPHMQQATPQTPSRKRLAFPSITPVFAGIAVLVTLLTLALGILPRLMPATPQYPLLVACIVAGGVVILCSIAIFTRPATPIARTITTHNANVQCIAFSRDGRLLASAGNTTIRVWHMGKARELFALSKHRGNIRKLVFTPDSYTLVSAGDDATVRLWNAEDGDSIQVLHGHEGGVGSVAVSPDGNLLASAGDDCTVRLWRIGDNTPLHTLREHTERVWNVAFSGDGRLLASAGDDGIVRIWHVADGMLIHTLVGHTSFISDIQFSPDNRLLASGSGDATVRLWRMNDGEAIHVLRGHTSMAGGVAFHPNGKLLASRSEDTTIQFWRVRDGSQLHTLKGHQRYVSGLAFAPDGKTMASVSWDTSVHIWRVDDGRLLRRLAGHTGRISDLSYSSDGRWLATASMDRTVRLWNVRRSRNVS